MSDIARSVDAFVFDAYGTLFDVHSMAALAEALAPGRGAALSRLWRAKQLEYTWLASLMQGPAQPREDFTRVTAAGAGLRGGGAGPRHCGAADAAAPVRRVHSPRCLSRMPRRR